MLNLLFTTAGIDLASEGTEDHLPKSLGVVDFKEKVLTHGLLDLMRGIRRLYTVPFWSMWHWFSCLANVEMRLILFNYFLVACRTLCFGGRLRFLRRPLPTPALKCELVKELTRIYLTLHAQLSGLLR